MDTQDTDLLLQGDLERSVTEYYRLQQDLGVRCPEELAREFVEMVLRYRRMTTFLNEKLRMMVEGD